MTTHLVPPRSGGRTVGFAGEAGGGSGPHQRQLQRHREVVGSGSASSPVTRSVVLHLRPPPTAEELAREERQANLRVTWEEGIADNPNQLVSKSCCVFHKKKLFWESSSDDDSSSSSSSDDDDHNNEEQQDASHSHGAAARDAAGGAAVTVEEENGNEEECCGGHHHHKKHKKKRPPCSKEHCYCGTRFH